MSNIGVSSFLGLGMASKHLWLLEGKEIEYNGKLSKEMAKHVEEVKSKEQK